MKRVLNILSYVGIALVFGALAIRLLKPEWDQYAVYASWAGLALVLVYTAGNWRELVAYFGQRKARYGALASISVLAGLGILIAVNYISARENKRWDLTENQQYTLADQTVRLLRELKAPVKFVVFDQGGSLEGHRPRLSEFEYHSDQVDVEYVDADRKPVLAKEYEIQAYGTIVVEYMGRRERVTSNAEQDLTNALIKVLNPQEKRVYFLSGHGEKDPADSERAGYSSIADALKRDNYQFEKLVLAQTNAIPDNATIVVIAGPRTDLLEGEINLLREYLAKRAGKLLVLLDPPEPGANQLPMLQALVREWSVEPGNNVVIDASGMGQLFGADASVPVVASYPSHAITQGFSLLTAYPLARSMSVGADVPAGRSAQAIIETSPRSWAETELRPKGEVELNEDRGDKPGPISIGIAVSAPAPEDASKPAESSGGDANAPKPETRLVVIGDSDFGANFALGLEGNSDLFMNSINWLAQQEGLIAIRPREPSDRRLTLTASNVRSLLWLSLVIVPAAVFGTGVFSWWRRR
jgi:ABC-type uncharacterized transport system involved in gliding motility auxiliary subunit